MDEGRIDLMKAIMSWNIWKCSPVLKSEVIRVHRKVSLWALISIPLMRCASHVSNFFAIASQTFLWSPRSALKFSIWTTNIWDIWFEIIVFADTFNKRLCNLCVLLVVCSKIQHVWSSGKAVKGKLHSIQCIEFAKSKGAHSVPPTIFLFRFRFEFAIFHYKVPLWWWRRWWWLYLGWFEFISITSWHNNMPLMSWNARKFTAFGFSIYEWFSLQRFSRLFFFHACQFVNWIGRLSFPALGLT